MRDTSEETYTEAKTFTHAYDPNGNLVEIVDNSADAQVDRYQVGYDQVNRTTGAGAS